MFNLSDKELDRLSRKAADAYEVENNTSSWDALEQRLDKELGTSPNPSVPSPRSFTFPFAYTSLIILLVGTSYFLLKSGKNSSIANKKNYSLVSKQQITGNNPSKEVSANPATEKNKVAVAPGANSVAALADEKKSAVIKSSEEKANAVLNKEDSRRKNISTNPKNKISSEKNTNSANNKEILASAGKNNPNNNESSTGKSHVASSKSSVKYFSGKNKRATNDKLTASNEKTNDITHNNKEDKHIEKTIEDKVANNHSSSQGKNFANDNPILKDASEENLKYASTSYEIHSFKHASIVISDSSLLAEATRYRSQDIVHLNKKNSGSLNTNRSLQIGISFAPDFSEVKHSYYNNRMGTGIGITLGYQLLNRLSINTGLIYEHKYYQTDDENFHLPRNLAPNGLHIEFVNGSCKMLEIPLNLRYDVSIEGNTTFFVNGGLSSYLIQKQDYLYYCHSYNNIGMSGWIKQSYDAAQNFWFSTLNLSAGFETSISNTISFQIEPYIKIPLRGVGIGNIQLSSYGVNIAIKFSPVLKRSRH